MQAFANEITDKTENIVNSNSNTLEVMDGRTPLFTSNEIIFPDDSVERPYVRYGYKLSNMNFLIPEHTASEVIQNPNIFTLPNAPYWVEGLINIRGNIVPVMNIDKLLNNKKDEKCKSILVLDKSDITATVAIMINYLPVSLEYVDNKTTPINYPAEIQEFIDSGFRQNNLDWVELDLQKLFKSLAVKDKV